MHCVWKRSKAADRKSPVNFACQDVAHVPREAATGPGWQGVRRHVHLPGYLRVPRHPKATKGRPRPLLVRATAGYRGPGGQGPPREAQYQVERSVLASMTQRSTVQCRSILFYLALMIYSNC